MSNRSKDTNESKTRRADSSQDTAKAPSLWLPVALVLVVGSLLGLQLITVKTAVLQGAGPLSFLAYTLVVAGLVLLFLSWRAKQTAPMTTGLLRYSFWSGLMFVAVNAVGFLAVRHVGAGFVALTFSFPILLTYGLALLLGIEKLKINRGIAVLFGLAGGLVLAISKATLNESAQIWILLTMSAPFVLAVGNIYRTRHWPQGSKPVYLASLMLLFGAALVAPFAIAFEGLPSLQLIGGNQGLVLFGIQAATITALYYFYFILQGVAGPVYLAQIGSIAAVVGGTVSVMFLGEALPPNLFLAAGLVIVGLVLFQSQSLPSVGIKRKARLVEAATAHQSEQ